AAVWRPTSTAKGWAEVLFGASDEGVPRVGTVHAKSRNRAKPQRVRYVIGQTGLILRLRVQGNKRRIEAAVLTPQGELCYVLDGAELMVSPHSGFLIAKGETVFPSELLAGWIKLVGNDGEAFHLRPIGNER